MLVAYLQIFNPRHACAARVMVVAMSGACVCVCVCLSVCLIKSHSGASVCVFHVHIPINVWTVCVVWNTGAMPILVMAEMGEGSKRGLC